MLEVESLKTRIGDNEMHYLKAGDGLPVVFLHGGASDSRDWVVAMNTLCQSYALYAPDLPGYGRNDRTRRGRHLSEFIDFTRSFVQSLGLDSPTLVGHSLGGRVCLEIALRYPQGVGKLVLVDAAGLGDISRWGKLLHTSIWNTRRALKIPQPYPAILPEVGEAGQWNCMPRLPGLTVPTLLVWKRHDPYFPLSIPRKAKQLISEASLVVVPGYGHAPHKQNADYFNKYLRIFLDGG